MLRPNIDGQQPSWVLAFANEVQALLFGQIKPESLAMEVSSYPGLFVHVLLLILHSKSPLEEGNKRMVHKASFVPRGYETHHEVVVRSDSISKIVTSHTKEVVLAEHHGLVTDDIVKEGLV